MEFLDLLHTLCHDLALSSLISYLIFYLKVTTVAFIEYQQKYQINFSVPEILWSKTVFFRSSHQTVFNKEIIGKPGTSENLNKSSSTSISYILKILDIQKSFNLLKASLAITQNLEF